MPELITTLLLAFKNAFPDTVILFPATNTVESLAISYKLMRLVGSLGIPAPHTWYVDNPASLATNQEKLPFPTFIKSGKLWLYYDAHYHRPLLNSRRIFKSWIS